MQSAVPTVINNSFLVQSAPKVHINPVFIEKLQKQLRMENELIFRETTLTSAPPLNPIIKHTKRKLVRASSAVIVKPSVFPREPLLAPLVKIGKNKLVRSTPRAPSMVPVKTAANVRKRFKLVNQFNSVSSSPNIIMRSKNLIRPYSLIRSTSLDPQKVIVTDPRLLKLEVVLLLCNHSYLLQCFVHSQETR